MNERAARLVDALVADAARLRIAVEREPHGGRVIDCGIAVEGGLDAGVRLAEICLSGLGHVDLVPGLPAVGPSVDVVVRTDHPLAACMRSQYAGWQLAEGKFFAMGSGPMRAAAAKEPLFERIGGRESAQRVVGVLETRSRPPEAIFARIAGETGVPQDAVTLLVAPTASQAGTLQVAARSVETALHKLLELDFAAERIVSGWGRAPFPPVAKNDLAAIGRTNDAVLYGAEVVLWVRGDDASIEAIGPRVPSGASPDFGQPFAEIFARYGHDFYKIDPHLFSPAVVTFVNLDTGRTRSYGQLRGDVLAQSFGD
ncbi:MAG: methenyltetrahydromethanopterin cyclohydrolase [Pirellulales bacterium]|nr:methenyltetrahydromethanopterin cyclohydrolase [Pirellulales bacterium]